MSVAHWPPTIEEGHALRELFAPALRRRSDTYREVVPRISSFYGIAIYMHWNEAHHARPHFHARYAGQAASVDLDGNVIAGSLPRRALALVAEWAQEHRDELEANWERARRAESLEPVDPLP